MSEIKFAYGIESDLLAQPESPAVLDPTVPEHWRRARMIADIMVARKSDSKPSPPIGGPGAN